MKDSKARRSLGALILSCVVDDDDDFLLLLLMMIIIIHDDNGHNNSDYYSDPSVPDDYDQDENRKKYNDNDGTSRPNWSDLLDPLHMIYKMLSFIPNVS